MLMVTDHTMVNLKIRQHNSSILEDRNTVSKSYAGGRLPRKGQLLAERQVPSTAGGV